MSFNGHKKWVMFPGRWQPLHKGHLTIINKALDEGKNVWIAIRDTEISESNPFTVKQREEMIKRAFGDLYGKRVIATAIPDIEAIHYSRGVGYDVKQIEVPKEISATKIRAGNTLGSHEDVSRYLQNLKATLWFTGLPCSGKTTLAKALGEHLANSERGYKINFLDGDDVRGKINSDLGFSEEDRHENLRRVAHMAEWANKNNNLVLASFVSPTNKMRDKVKNIIGENMKLIVKCGIDECVKRDVKGMYAEALAGKRPGFTGIDPDAPFEEPENADLILDTENKTVDECAQQIVEYFKF